MSQAETVPDVDSIDIQTEIQWYMRPYLLDFLVEAHSAFQLLPETLFLTVNILDRYCSKRVVYKRHYQLVGCAALLVAAKYGDKKEKVPTIKELKSMCCSLYDDDMFLQMEWHVLSTLDWSVGHPTVDSFLKLAVKDSIPDPETENLALYILEMGLFHREFVSKQSSTLALAALALSKHILGRPQARASEYASRYCEATLVELSQKLHQPSEILSRKYASGRFSGVSRILNTFLVEQAALAAVATAAQRAPSPSRNYASVSKSSYAEQYGYNTPQKPQFQSTMQHGYPTPPITPEEEYFGKDPRNLPVPHHYTPITPTPTAPMSQCSGFDYRDDYGAAPSSWMFETYHEGR